MAVHRWRQRETKYFGRVGVPFAEIGIRAASGIFIPFAVQVDSGAVISLLRRSAADMLGVALEAGRRVELTSVGRAQTVAYVHDLPTRLGEGIIRSVPYAISSAETVPNLLGRIGVFDSLRIEFNGALAATIIEEV